MQRRVREKRYRIWGALFLGGFFLGMLLMNVSGDKLLGESGIFNPGMMRQLALEEIDGGQFLIYVLRQRYGILLGMFLLSPDVHPLTSAVPVPPSLWNQAMTVTAWRVL